MIEGPTNAAKGEPGAMGDGQVDPRRRGLFNFRALRAQAAAWSMLKGSPARYLPRYYRREKERLRKKDKIEKKRRDEGGQPQGNEQGVTLSRSP